MLRQGEEKTQHFIAHRALLNGPNKQLENQPSSIEKCISQGYMVEIDVWYFPESSSFFIGHDGPEIPSIPNNNLVTFSDLERWAPHAYFHAKNIDALHELLPYCCNNEWKCFFHDIDEYTITSDQKIWAYPGKKLTAGAICVMPERAPKQGSQSLISDNLSKCYAICTDFAEQYRIYEEMRIRQEKDLIETKTIGTDSMIKEGMIDTRRCVAVYTFYDNWTPSNEFASMKKLLSINFSGQNVYDTPQSSISVLHFTIMQIFGFEQYEEYATYFFKNKDEYFNVFRKVLKKHLPFTITFRGLIAVKTGIIMSGYPSIDLNLVRSELYKELQAKNLHYRKYTNNIVHSTIVRATTHRDDIAQRIIEIAEKYRDTYFGILEVTQFHLGISSWRMMANELEPVGVI